MEIQEKSLFELALEAIKEFQNSGDEDWDADVYCMVLDELGKGMRDHDMPRGVYRWGNYFLNYRLDKQGTPITDVYEKKTASLMSLPGWTEYKARKGVKAAELLEG